MTTQTAPRPAAVAAVLAKAHQWTAARRKLDGVRFYYIQGSAGTTYMANALNCSCPSAQHRSTACKHSAAVALHQARQTAQTPAPAAAPRKKSYAELFGPDED